MPLISPEATPPGNIGHTSLYIPLLAYAAGVIFLALAGYQTFRQIENLIQQEKLNDLNAIAAMKTKQIVSWRESQLRRGEALSRTTLLPSEFEQWLREGAPANTRRQKIAQMVSSSQQVYGYRLVSLIDRQGAVRLASNGDTVLGKEEIELARQAMKEGKTILSDIHNDSVDGKADIDLVAPLIVHDENRSRVVGAAILKINPGNFLYPLIRVWPTHSSTAETLLVRQEGKNFLYLNELRHRKDKALTLRLPVDTPNLPPGMFLRGKLDPLNSVDYRGVPVVASVSRIPGTTWLMVAKIDKAELFAPIRQIKHWSVAVGLVFLGGCGVSFFVWFQSIQVRYRHLKTQRDAAIHNGLMLKHFEYLTQYANDIILVADDNGRITEANDRAVSAYGYTRDELRQMQIWDLRPSTDDLSAFHEQISHFRESGGLTFETTNRRKDGSIFPVEISARAIELEGVNYLQGIIRDITERKAAEQRIARLNDLYATISQTDSAIVRIKNQAALLQEICRIVVEHGHFRLAWVGLTDTEHGCIKPVASSGLATGYLDGLIIPIDAEKAEGQGPTGSALHQGKTVICNDFQADPRTLPWHDNARKYGLCSSASWPLRQAGKTMGALNLYAGETNYFDDEMVQLLSSVSQDISFALDNLAMEETLRQSADELRKYAERVEDLYNNAPCGYHSLDKNGVIVQINHTELQWLGYAREEMVGKMNIRDLHTARSRQTLQQNWNLFKEKGYINDLAFEFIRKDGSVLPVMVNGTAIYGQDGEFVMSRSSVFDDSARRLAEESLRESEARFRAMADNAPIIIWMADAQGAQDYSGCGFFNQRWHDFTGLTLAQTQGQNWLERVHPDDRMRSLKTYQEAFRLREPFEHEFRLMRHDTEYRWILDSGVPRYAEDGLSENGKFIGFIGTCIDITEQKNSEAMRGEIERAGRLNIAVEMASGLAHELSQPLSAANNYLTGCLHRMKDAEWDKEKLRMALELTHKQTERAGSIINHLKNLIRKQGHERLMTDINALIRDMLDFLGHEIKQRGILVVMTLSPLPLVLVNKVEIEQVLINLFKNAIEAMRGAPGAELRIVTADLRDAGQIQVTVGDNGRGISSAELATIFNPFHTSKTDGLGLGLAICRSLVENHGGRIWVDAQLGFGAEFNFTLPCEATHEPEFLG